MFSINRLSYVNIKFESCSYESFRISFNEYLECLQTSESCDAMNSFSHVKLEES